MGQIAVRVGSGVTPTGGSDVYTDSGVTFIRSQNVTNAGLRLEDVAYIDQRTHSRMSASAVLPFDILLNITGASIGRCCFAPESLGEANVNQHVCVIRLPNANQYDATFLSSLMASHIGQRQIARLNAGANREGLNYQQLRSFHVPWPPHEYRASIARVLSTLDLVIEQTEALIAKYQQIKAGLMHDLFTRGVTPDGRLRPPRQEKPELYMNSPLGFIPREWKVEPLGDLLAQCGGYLQTGPFGSQLHAHEYQTEGVPVVMPQDINDGVIEPAQLARISEARATDLARHSMRLGDVVIARRGDLSRAAAISSEEESWICGTGCFLLRLGTSPLRATYAALAYRHNFIQRQIAGMAVGTTMPSLNNTVMGRLLFPFCSPDEQIRITDRIGSIQSAVRLLTSHRRALGAIKQGLMHDLLTGEVRVTVKEAAAT